MRRIGSWLRVPGWLRLVTVAVVAALSGGAVPAVAAPAGARAQAAALRGAASPGAASLGLDLRQPLAATPSAAPQRPGLRTTTPTPQALAAAVQQATGLAPAQVAVQNVCPAPRPGYAACAAQALVLRSDHRLIHPHVTPRPTFTQVFPRRRAHTAAAIGPQGSMSSTPASAPSAGTPGYLQEAYDLTYLSQTAGGSDTIAVVDAGDDPNAASDLAAYRSTYGLAACTTANGCFAKVNESGGSTPLPPSAGSDWEEEESLDLDAISALCPNCHILLVETNSASLPDLDAGITAAETLGANQVSNSWAGSSSSPIGVGSFPGASIIAATGDHGYLGAGTDDYPAAYPGVTAAGGTTLSGAGAPTSTRGYSESAWSLNSSGAGWGATSGCDLTVAKPTWQSDTGCTGRAYADVSADANPDTGLRIYDSGDGGWFVEGGTSLASPLIAAFEALTGVNGTTAQWAYSDSALLNDVTSGSSGSCATAIAYICTAGTGYDGPTGAGSISGDIVSGAPGIGGPPIGSGSGNSYTQAVGTTTATLAGGVYPNGLDTTYDWQYGTTTAYGQHTATIDVGAGAAPVGAPATLSGLTPGITYHYRLVATNGDGTDYGYDYTLSTSSVSNVAPVNSLAPSVSGQPLQGQTLTASTGSWTPTPTTYAYQWQRSTDGGSTWSSIAGATTSTYTVATSDLGDDLEVVVTATNSFGSTAAGSAPAGPVGSGAPVQTATPTISGHADQGQVLSAISTWNPAGTAYAYQWQTSSDGGTTWTNLSGATTSTYTVSNTDLGHELRVTVTASNTYGSASSTSAAIGPVAANAPINTNPPTVTGTTQRLSTLTATPGAWTGAGNAITYQWQRSPDGSTWTAITNATNFTYNLGQADEGDVLRVVVTATNTFGVSSIAGAATGMISPYPPANTVAPAITGVAERGSVLNASQGTWTGPDNVYSYQWQRDGGEGFTNVSGATGSNYALGVADEGANVRVLVTATNPDATISVASAPTATVADALPVNQAAPTITGTVQRGSVLTAAVGTWAGLGNAYTYQWQSSPDGSTWNDIASATNPIYTVAQTDEGDQLRVLVTATNPDGTSAVPSAATIAVPTSPPVSTSAPTINGTAQRGLTLSGARGGWSGPGNAYTYQWQRSVDGTTWTNIAGATGLSYTLAVADEGDEVRLSVTATNPDGSVTVASQPSAMAVAALPVNTSAPVLSGTPLRSSNLTANVGAWNGIGNTYTAQWQHSPDGSTWTNIGGATAWTYAVAVADEGDQLRVVVTAANADGTASTPSPATTAVSAAPPVNTTAPTIAGAAIRGDALTTTQGAWGGLGNAYSEQWQRSADGGTTWTSITGATAASYTLTVADEGDVVRLLVTVANPDATVSAATPATATVQSAAPANTAAPALSGPSQRGLTLVSSQGTWNGIGNSLTYQWQRSPDGTTWTNITGATNPSYQVALADEGDVLRLLVTATNPDGTVSAASPPTSTVTATPPSDTVAPTLSGTAQRGGTLVPSAGTWLGVGNAYAYQWQRSTDGGSTWTNILGATSSSYGVGVVDENSQIRIQVTATNLDGAAIADSAPTTAVPVSAPVNTVAPTVSGTAQRGFLLSATPGTWGGIGNSLAYQWQRSTDGTAWTAIAGATSTTYTLGIGDEGAAIRILVTAANPDGTVSAPSAATATVIGSPPANTAQPTITGIARRGNALSSNDGTWSGSGNTFSLQWQRSADGTTWTNIAGATGPGYTFGQADEGDTVRLQVTAANPDGTVSAVSPVTAAVLAAPPVNTAPPLLSGTAQRTATLNASSGSWSGVGDVLAYQWQRSTDGGTTWTNIAAATTAAYTLAVADESDNVRVLVTATNLDATVSAPSAPSAAIATDPPVNAQVPTIVGAPSLGGTLTAAPGTWSPLGAAYTYQWQRGDATDGYTDIAGATGSTYTTVAADVGENIQVVVTATNPDGSGAATSAPTQTVQQPPVNLVAPSAPTGTLMNGSVLTPDTGSWDSPVTFAYVWLRCPGTATSVSAGCTPVSNASTYTLTVNDIGYEMAVTMTATSVGGSTTANSALTGVVAGQPLTDGTPPSISGNPQPPNTLYANPGSWSVALSTVNYQWERCAPDGVSACSVVAADTAHYTLSAADDGHTIVLIADVTSPGRTGTAQSQPLTVQAQPLPQATILPTVSGTPTRTFSLGATGGTWTNNPTALSYQWERCNTAGTGCASIPGATQVSYQLGAGDEGYRITVAVSATNSSGTNTASAVPSGVVGGLLPVDTHLPGLSTLGVQQSAPVTVSGATWQATSDTTYATQWERCNAGGTACAAIAGATAGAYTPAAADVGHTLVAVITATNVDGSVSSASPASDVVLPAAPRWRDLPVLSTTGDDVAGVITITPGSWTGPAVSSDVTALMRCTNTCVSVSSGSSYTIANGDVGAILRARETASNAGGTTVIWSAGYVGPVGSVGSASAVALSGQAVLRNVNGAVLAIAQVATTTSVSGEALVAGHARRGAATVRQVTIHRAARLRGTLRAWVCPVTTGRAAPGRCTAQVSIRGAKAKLRLPATMTGRVRIVVVRRGR
ncbi:MAG TPA: hypothetical protein VHX62_11815 [Solirubrobacteraceae bacterium]|jgi:hypothetical protein|nr:hypothetical protein [Solirubrobacteraceae bacterium]